MGYLTRYKLSAPALDYVDPDAEMSAEDVIEKELDGYNPFVDICKWYSWEKDMTSISRKYPDTVFTLYGEGEESGDVWKAYFKNGKKSVHTAEIKFPDFDESKLK